MICRMLSAEKNNGVINLKNNHIMKKLLTIIGLAAVTLTGVNAQVVLNSLGTYTQDFNGYTAFNADAAPLGWITTFDTAAFRGFTSNGSSIAIAGTSAGSITSGGLFSWGEELAGPAIGNSTFAWQGTGTTANMVTTASFLNSTGATVTELTLSFNAYQWRQGTGLGRSSTLDLSGSGNLVGLNLFNFTAGTTDAPAVGRNFGSPAPSGFAEDVSFSQTLSGLDIADGDSFSFAFTYNRGAGSGSAQGIAMDNFSLTAVPEPATWALVALGGTALVVLRRRRASRA